MTYEREELMIERGDEADRGNSHAEAALQAQIAAIRSEIGKTLKPTGHCLFCGEALAGALLFCPAPDGAAPDDPTCGSDWQRQRAAKVRNGR
ncbi:hypothetical protein [Caballeronia zhejiangensis]|uniref:Uncharacterized protein n=1 Tax=Caballeronia zhejiangensis TaxID=871203 RepID=A0A656QFV2_9BURK|nr:hypothetical protein [Caballeronia zhejiangensis]KDR25936.1 hypothetical protein BG60_26210 [Caballeronia zhejiangensis]